MGEHSPSLVPISVENTVQDGVPVTGVTGEIDNSTVEVVAVALIGQVDQASAATVADLSGVRFMDSSGITMLLEIQRHAAARGVGFAVATDNRAVVRPLEVTGLAAVVRLSPSVGEAIIAARASSTDLVS